MQIACTHNALRRSGSVDLFVFICGTRSSYCHVCFVVLAFPFDRLRERTLSLSKRDVFIVDMTLVVCVCYNNVIYRQQTKTANDSPHK